MITSSTHSSPNRHEKYLDTDLEDDKNSLLEELYSMKHSTRVNGGQTILVRPTSTLSYHGGPQGGLDALSGEEAHSTFGTATTQSGSKSVIGGRGDETLLQRSTSKLSISPKIHAEANQEAEEVLHDLMDYPHAFKMLSGKIKATITHSKDTITFFKKRGVIEEEYAKAMFKLVASAKKQDSFKDGSYGEGWAKLLDLHSAIGNNRLELAKRITTIAETMQAAVKNTERERKQIKEAGQKHWRAVQDAETALDRANGRWERDSADWEREMVNTSANEMEAAVASTSTLARSNTTLGRSHSVRNMFKPSVDKLTAPPAVKSSFMSKMTSNPFKKNEQEIRDRLLVAQTNLKRALADVNHIKTTYYQSHLPRFIGLLKHSMDSGCNELLQHIKTYSADYERGIMEDAVVLSPIEKDEDHPGILDIVQSIDFASDFATFFEVQKGANMSSIVHPVIHESPNAKADPLFGVDLVTLMTRTQNPTPPIIENMLQRIAQAPSTAIYRIQGVSPYKASLDLNTPTIDLSTIPIHDLVCLVKRWFQELPSAVIPKVHHQRFLEAACANEERLRLIGVHECVNQLHDAHYATLQMVTRHLSRLWLKEKESNVALMGLSVVWGPLLMDPVSSDDIKLSSKIVEILVRYSNRIFEMD